MSSPEYPLSDETLDQVLPADSPASSVAAQLAKTWHDAPPGDLLGVVAESHSRGESLAAIEVDELVTVDIEHRWRCAQEESVVVDDALGDRPTARDYAREILPAAGQPRLKWIAAEYRARRLWGDQPRVEQMLTEYEESSGLTMALLAVDSQQALADRPATPTATSLSAGPGDASFTVRCPHCHEPVKVFGEGDLSDVNCLACGTSFDLLRKNRDAAPEGGTRIAHFELLRQLGHGGFGTVWEAKDTKLDRLVAIKTPRRGQLSEDEMGLFLREARSAAQLRHPNIVAIHEVGVEEGVPYLVSDLIHGVSLADRLGADSALSGREAAELCATLAAALHHAHESGVVHRDIKPANVLIDDAGTPHLTDFGIAKRDVGEVTITAEGQVLGTPAYMSPEQARGEGNQSDRRTDIYSMGAVLFELLTGETPFRGNARMLIQQAIADEPPQPRQLNRNISLDLQTICLKCLEKEPGRRYATAELLEADLQRFLRGEPIAARPVGPLQRRWRWCKRNPTVASLTAAAAALLVTVAAVATTGYVQTSRALVEKERARATEAQVSEFLTNLFLASDPLGFATGKNYEFVSRDPADAGMTARELLDRGAERVRVELADQPEVQASLMETIGGVYRSLALFDRAEEVFREALAARQQMSSPDEIAIASAKNNLAWALRDHGKYAESETLYREALAVRRDLLGADHLDTTSTMQGLALLLAITDGEPEAHDLLTEVVATRKRVSGKDSEGVAIALASLGAVQWDMMRHEDANRSILESYLILSKRREGLPNAGNVLMDYQSGLRAAGDGRYDEAERLMRGSIETAATIFGERHPFVTWIQVELARVLSYRGEHRHSLAMYEKAITGATQVVGSRHPELVNARLELVDEHLHLAQHSLAEPLLRDLEQDLVVMYGSESHQLAAVQHDLSRCYRFRGDTETALKEARRGLLLAQSAPPLAYRTAADLRDEVANCMLQLDKPDEAIAALQPISKHDDGTIQRFSTMEIVARAHALTGRLSEAELAYRNAIKVAERSGGSARSWAAVFETGLGKLLAARGEVAEAEQLLRKAHSLLQAEAGGESLRTQAAAQALAELAEKTKSRKHEP